MVENYVCNQLTANDYTNYYWESDRGAEVDFVIQRDGRIIPIEVKSADNTKAKSLKIYMDMNKPEYAIKISTRNFGFEDSKKTIPLYAAFASDLRTHGFLSVPILLFYQKILYIFFFFK